MLRYFAAVLPPTEVQTKVAAFAEKANLKGAKVTTNPHIKVATRDGMDPDPNWETVITELARQTKPFEVRFGEPQFLGDYLLTIPIISPALEEAHRTSVSLLTKYTPPNPDESPEQAEAFYEGQSLFTAHMSLATGNFGCENFFGLKRERRSALKLARSMLGNLPSFTATELALYEALVFGQSYRPRGVIALGTASSRVGAPAGLPEMAA